MTSFQSILSLTLSSDKSERNQGEMQWKQLQTSDPNGCISHLVGSLLTTSGQVNGPPLSLAQAKMACVLLRKCVKTRAKVAALNIKTQQELRPALLQLINGELNYNLVYI